MKDPLLQKEMAANAETIGVNKANAPIHKTVTLAILAGAFIAFGAAFFTNVTANPILTDGFTKLIGGLCFSLGLVLVIVGGAELFTGNTLIVMSLANGKITVKQVLKNWLLVFLGNFVGAAFVAILLFLAKNHHVASGSVGIHLLNIANKKCELGFVQALSSGILCNILVCLAVWLSFSSKSISGKILAIIFPISAFVTLGLEHSIANLFFVPEALLILDFDPDLLQAAKNASSASYESITWGNFLLNNLLPVTLGNILGGGVFVGLVYWFVYLRHDKTAKGAGE